MKGRNFEVRPGVEALKGRLQAMPGAVGEPSPVAGVTVYKVMGKMFAILIARQQAVVVLKCDPHLAEILRERYRGVGHRTHLDRRHWIAVDLEADVPKDEIEQLAAGSYDLVCASLTRKQRSELMALASPD
jgi:predicted DNA-binding protein (MmcQ/YjbR family)